MKKIFFIFSLIACSIGRLRAQAPSTIAFSIGPELNMPQRSVYRTGYGISGKLEVPLVNSFSLSLTGAFTRLVYKNNLIGNARSATADEFIPLKGGMKYYSSGRFYLEGEMGSALQQGTGNRKLFLYSLGPGFLFPLSNDKTALDVGLRYESWSKSRLNQLGIRVAYGFGGVIGS